MKSAPAGRDISRVEVTRMAASGIGLRILGEDKFLSFDHFPCVRSAPVEDVFGVELPTDGHLYWAALDIDLAVESTDHPERFPLVSKVKLRDDALQRHPAPSLRSPAG